MPPNNGDRDKSAKRNKNSTGADKRPKAEPRVSLAPLDFEDALENLLAVKPPARDEDQTPSES